MEWKLGMDGIDSVGLMELSILLESSIDTQFQAWITVTFAFVVATYASRGQLAKRIQVVVSILYLLVVIALFARWMADASRLLEMIEVLAERGIDFGPAYFIAPYTRILVYILGSIVAVYLSYYYSKENGDST